MLYPQPILAAQLALNPEAIRRLWEVLNAINPEILIGNGRVYGGGLHKLEPGELANVPADDMAAVIGLLPKRASHQLELLEEVAA